MGMTFVTKMYVLLSEAGHHRAGQTMTEYVLIIAAIAVAGYVAYQGLEVGINGIIAKVTTSLSAA
jgi:Flp pilus assembly pilin Flp